MSPALLYVRSGCTECESTRADLIARGVPFRELDVSARPELVPELLKLTGGRRVLPVVVEGGTILVGRSAF